MLVIFSRPVVKVLKIDLGRSLKFTKLHGILKTYKKLYMLFGHKIAWNMGVGDNYFLLNT